MSNSDVLIDAFGRLPAIVHRAVDDATTDDLTWRADPEANTLAWLTWHLTRVQDQAIAAVSGQPQVWEEWRELFALPFSDRSTGYGHSPDEVAAVDASAALLLGYFDAVTSTVTAFLESVTDAALAEVVDPSFDPPVTLQVRLTSVLGDSLQHAGQAAFIRGITGRLL